MNLLMKKITMFNHLENRVQYDFNQVVRLSYISKMIFYEIFLIL